MPETPQPETQRARAAGRPRGRRSRSFNTTMTAEELTARGQAAANARWARTSDRVEATRALRDGRTAGYYAEADRLGVTDQATRDKMAHNAQREEMARLRQIQLSRQRQPAPPPPRPARVTQAQREACVAFIGAHPGVSPGDIADLTGLTIQQAGSLLLRLADAGRIARLEHGVYGPAQAQDGVA